MANPNNCSTCEHKQINEDNELWCYMFKEEPKEQCMQHTGNHAAFDKLVANFWYILKKE
jgi:hypothetical protein